VINIDDLERIKREVERKQQEKDRAEGALNEILSRLKKEYGVSSLKEAKALLKKLEQEEVEEAEKFQKAKKEFEKACEGHL